MPAWLGADQHDYRTALRMIFSDILVLQVRDVLALLLASAVIGSGLVVLAFVAVVWGLGRLLGKALTSIDLPQVPAYAPAPPGFADSNAAALSSGDPLAHFQPHGTLTTREPNTVTVPKDFAEEPAAVGLATAARSECSFCQAWRQRIRNAAKKFLRKKK